MENKKEPTSKEFINKLKKLGLENEIEFYFVPSNELKNKIVRGGDPIISKLPDLARTVFLELPQGKGVALYTPMVIKYLDGTLDKNNSYIFDLGEIRVRNANELIVKGLNRSNNMKKE